MRGRKSGARGRFAGYPDLRIDCLILQIVELDNGALESRAYRVCHMKRPINDLAEDSRQELGALIAKYSSGDGMHSCAIPGLYCIRLSEPHMQLPTVYQPSIWVIVQGAKQVLLVVTR